MQPAPGQKTASGVGNSLAEDLTSIRWSLFLPIYPSAVSPRSRPSAEAALRPFRLGSVNTPPVLGTPPALWRKQWLGNPWGKSKTLSDCDRRCCARCPPVSPALCSGPMSERFRQPNPPTPATVHTALHRGCRGEISTREKDSCGPKHVLKDTSRQDWRKWVWNKSDNI